jgi:hypothetical protein
MLNRGLFALAILLVFAVMGIPTEMTMRNLREQTDPRWDIHDRNRPTPDVVDPGTTSTQEKVGQPPSDAIVLFDGKDLSQWQMQDGGPPKWKLAEGHMEVVSESGSLVTKRSFGNCQLHIEWSIPVSAEGEDQDRGNSGVFLMGLYEIQVLDSYQNRTYADGQAAAVYGQYSPLVNASRPPGRWQTYDIIFRGPRFDNDGNLTRRARVTVLHNGVVVQDNVELTGSTAHKSRPPYEAHPDKLPLLLQDHQCPVRYRNIWLRELPEI